MPEKLIRYYINFIHVILFIPNQNDICTSIKASTKLSYVRFLENDISHDIYV